MSGDLGDISAAMGDAVTGSALARSVEPHADGTGASAIDGDGTACLNCGTQLIGAHCHTCGQKGEIHRSLSGFLHDLVHGVLHFEGKMWRTLPLLVLKPGELTKRYVEGQRARFVSPMALFLFSVFMMFAVFQVLGISTPTTLNASGDLEPQLEAAQETTTTQLDTTRKKLAAMAADDPARKQTEDELLALEETAKGIDRVSEVFGKSANNEMTFTSTGIAALDEGFLKKWRANPSLMLYKLQNNSYKFSWLLIPLSIPFVWLLFFWKWRFRAYDHAVFVTYSLAFMSLLFLTLSVAGIIGVWPGLIVAAALLIPPVHIYKQMRHGYALTRFSAAWRTVVLTNLIVFIVVTIFVWLLLLIGAM